MLDLVIISRVSNPGYDCLDPIVRNKIIYIDKHLYSTHRFNGAKDPDHGPFLNRIRKF